MRTDIISVNAYWHSILCSLREIWTIEKEWDDWSGVVLAVLHLNTLLSNNILILCPPFMAAKHS